jgi:DeoR/GlpR family transcriptional regulator of sugar metabolism
MTRPENIKSKTNSHTAQPTTVKVDVLTQMDSLTQVSTATIRRDMAESVKKDVKVLRKFGLLTPSS